MKARIIELLATGLVAAISLVCGQASAGTTYIYEDWSPIGGFDVVSTSMFFDPITGNQVFTSVFNQEPDFLTKDQYGRQHHGFQYFVFSQDTEVFDRYQDWNGITRIGMLVCSGNATIIVSAYDRPPDQTECDQEWGIAQLPFELTGSTLTFSVPDSLLSTSGRSDYIYWDLMTATYGASNYMVYYRVPEPSTFALFGLGLAGLGFTRRRIA